MKKADSFPTFVSESTSVTESMVSSEVGWFGLKEIAGIARCLKQSIPPAIDNFAESIHKSAMNIAAEFSEMEKEARRESEQWVRGEFGEDSELTVDGRESEEEEHKVIPLPWEVHVSYLDESIDAPKLPDAIEFREDSVLKEKILSLSQNDYNFLEPFDTSSADLSDSPHFILDDAHIDLIRRLLIIDDKLTKVHARLRAHDGIKETTFWRNYFHHCELMRDKQLNEYDDIPEGQRIQHPRQNHQQEEQEYDVSDGELVEAPLISCTGYYTRSDNPSIGNSNDQQQLCHNPCTLSSDSLVLIGTSEEDLKAAII